MNDLAAAVARLSSASDASSQLVLPRGVSLAQTGATFTLSFAPAVEAMTVARAFQWVNPYALSADVHQRNWRLQLWESGIKDPFNARIETQAPRVGDWYARVELDGRPEGELPKLVAGASPPYDLSRYHAKVVTITFSRGP